MKAKIHYYYRMQLRLKLLVSFLATQQLTRALHYWIRL